MADRANIAKINEDYLSRYGFHDPEEYLLRAPKGVNHELVEIISRQKNEPDWMRAFRHEALDIFLAKPMPQWGNQELLQRIDFDNIYYYIKPTSEKGRSWDDVPENIKNTFDRLGVPEAERKFLAGVSAQYESEVIYHSFQEDLQKQGIVFLDMDSGLREYPELVREYFSTVIPPTDNKFAALNSAVWSGGSFIYVPPGVKVNIPLQAYFRINAQNMGQFERTLIIADKGASVHYVEGCFLAGARVRTRQGDKAIEEVLVGDEVLTHKGRYRRVYQTMERPYRGMIYKIRYFGDSGQELRVTEEHPLLLVKRERSHERDQNFSPAWKTAGEIKPGDYLAIPVPRVESTVEEPYRVTVPIGRGGHQSIEEEVVFPLEYDFFRLLGYYHAEGYAHQEHHAERYAHQEHHAEGYAHQEHDLTFSFNVREAEFLDDVRELTTRYFGKRPIENKPRQNGQTLVVFSNLWARVFSREFGATASGARVPDFIRNAPTELLSGWVRGLWRGDGSYDKGKNMFRLNTISRELACSFRDALLRLGVAASINYQKRNAPRQPMFTVVISSPWNEKFGEIVGFPAPDGNKSNSPFSLDEAYLYVPIRSIEIEEVDRLVFNFSVEEDESYIGEGVVSHNCTAPMYSSDSLHSAVVELVALPGATIRYTTIQNWSPNVYNLVTKRALAHEEAVVEWIDANLGSRLTMKYPCVYLVGERAHGEVLSIAMAGDTQHQDAGAKMIHAAPNTSSRIVSKSISRGEGRTSYRGLVKVHKNAHNARTSVECDALLLDERSRSDTYPTMEIAADDVQVEHEARVSKLGEEQLFYLQSRGIDEDRARLMVVNGFIEPFVRELPMEYAVEMNRLIELEMEGSVG